MSVNVMSRTVSNLSSAELDVYRKALRNRKRVAPRNSARLRSARKVVRKAASILRKQFGVGKIVLFGSVANPRLFHSRSDVDLAVWGLGEGQYFRAVSALLGIDPEINVDLIEFEFASPSMQAVILQNGKPL